MMIRYIIAVVSVLILAVQTTSGQYEGEIPEGLNFLVVGDSGYSGLPVQDTLAGTLASMVRGKNFGFVATTGDIIHSLGVASANDPRFRSAFEDIYSDYRLHIPWYIILGNHEYQGNSGAVLDYANVSIRWKAPARYYSMECDIPGSDKRCLLAFIDTSPMIGTYRNNAEKYPDAGLQQIGPQIEWLDSVLCASEAFWKIVIGHHPVVSEGNTGEGELSDIQRLLLPLLQKHRVDFYVSGHVHNFQYLNPGDGNTHYVINSSTGNTTRIRELPGLIYGKQAAGFSFFSVRDNEAEFRFVDYRGEELFARKVRK